MAYCTQEDILALEMDEKTLRQLTDAEKTGTIDEAIVTAAISKADEDYIDSYSRKRYSVPFSPVPGQIKRLSAIIAAYYLHRRKPKAPNGVLDKYAKAVATLKGIAMGTIELAGGTVLIDSTGIASTTEDEAQTFTRTKYDSSGNIIGNPGSMEPW